MDGTETIIARGRPEPDEARRRLCAGWATKVRQGKKHHEAAFKRMRDDMAFAAGRQWPGQTEDDDRYVANIVLRHVQQRVASLYAKNPKVVAKRRPRMTSTLWNGSMDQLQTAQQALMAGADPMAMAQAMAIIQDAQQAQARNQMLDNVARTLELFYQYNVDEQSHPFKAMMKMTVRRAVTAGVAYVKVGFQRAMRLKPDVEARIADVSERLATIERIAADMADGETQPDAPEAEQLRLTLQALQAEPMILVREGLVFDYPDSTHVIPDPKCRQLREFLGADWVAQEYHLSPDEIKEIYKLDVGKDFTAYVRSDEKSDVAAETRAILAQRDGTSGEADACVLACVWEIYSRKDGLVYVVCDGYPDFLQDPAPPEVYTERFWPWYPLVLNETYEENAIFPPSDVRLMRDMQTEFNRARQGLREHRRANRPKIATSAGSLDDTDKEKLSNHPANALIELNGLTPGQKVSDLLQPLQMPPIDFALYDTGPAFDDVLRVVGAQEANLGGTGGATATETSIAESSRMSAQSSNIDDLDDLLTQIARAGGQILLGNVDEETVKATVGEGAVWPQMDREGIAKEIYLEIQAGSTGRPNQAREVQNFQTMAPFLMQIPGITPEFLAREAIKRLDDRLDLADAFNPGLPSIQSLNRAPQVTPAGPGEDPNAQGGEGADNAPAFRRPNVGPRPDDPNAQDPNTMDS